MKKLWILALALVLTLASLSIPAATAEESPTEYTSGDYRYTLQSDGTAAITGYSGSASTLSIPGTLDGHAVTSIGTFAFQGRSSLTSISIPDSVTSIGAFAFWGCSSLTSISIPNSVTSIGRSAFKECSSLTSITIPNSVTDMDNNPFSSCRNLTQIIVSPDHPVFTVIDGVLINKLKGRLVCYPFTLTQTSYAIPDGITSIGGSAFDSCYSLTSITIPDSVTSIGDFAFAGCISLTSITIPNSVTSIDDYAFLDCESLTNITIPSSVISIGEEAFASCSSLASVSIPNSVTSIGNFAFDVFSDSLTLTVARDSYAEEWCELFGMNYTYSNAHN